MTPLDITLFGYAIGTRNCDFRILFSKIFFDFEKFFEFSKSRKITMYNRNVTDKQISNCQYSEKYTNFLEHFLQRHVNIKNRICTLSKFRFEHRLLSSGKARRILMHISAFPYRFPSECTHCTCRERCTMQTAYRSREPFRIGGQFGIGTSARVDVHSLKNMCTFACLCEGCFVGLESEVFVLFASMMFSNGYFRYIFFASV